MQYDINEEPIILSKPTLDICLKQDNPGDLIALYSFYYYTAKWQRTNQPKCTTSYAAQGLKWGEDKIRDRKQALIKLRLIEDIQARDEKTNQIIGHFIKVNFIWSKDSIEHKSHPGGFPDGGQSQRVENTDTNALITGNTNTHITNNANALITDNENQAKKEDVSPSKRKALPPDVKLPEFLQHFPIEFQQSNRFQSIWAEWLQHRKEIGHSIKKTTAIHQSKFLSGLGLRTAIQSIELSITSGYQGLFEPDGNKTPSHQTAAPGKYSELMKSAKEI